MDDGESREIPSDLKILKAAEEIFAEEGFDGARVDDIAKRAGVNKALIYYYFKSKEQIMEEISKRHLMEIFEAKKDLVNNFDLEHGIDQNATRQMLQSIMWTTLGNQKDFLSIVLIEALKNNSDENSFFKLINQTYDNSMAIVEQMGHKIDRDKYKTMAMFFGILPIIFYIVIVDKWAEYNHIDKDKAKETFMDAMTEIEFNLLISKFSFFQDKKVLDSFRDGTFSSLLDKRTPE